MRRGIKRSFLLAGLAVFGAMVVGGSDIRAGTVKPVGTSTPLPGGSPFLYQFGLYLTSGSIAPGATFTVGALPGGQVSNGLIGVTTQSGTGEPSGTGNPFALLYPTQSYFWVVPAGGIVTVDSGMNAPYNNESSVTWQYLLGPTLTWNGSDIYLGLFTVETAQSFPDDAPPATPGVTKIDYSYTGVTGGNTPSSGGSSITISAVPEPTSSILLLIGGAALPLLLRSRCRSQVSRKA
jgi:hypothetical protein